MYKFEPFAEMTQAGATYIRKKDKKECKQSVHGNAYTRKDKAKEQCKKKTVPVDEIIKYLDDFLSDWLNPPQNLPRVFKYETFDCKKKQRAKREELDVDYEKIKRDYGLHNIRDIVWLKFTTDGYLGVVAMGDDINFQLPPKADVYDLLENPSEPHDEDNNPWVYNSSGILVHHVGQKWDDSFVMLVPLPNIPQGHTTHDIEKAIGNYLIEKEIPIIDFFSHLY